MNDELFVALYIPGSTQITRMPLRELTDKGEFKMEGFVLDVARGVWRYPRSQHHMSEYRIGQDVRVLEGETREYFGPAFVGMTNNHDHEERLLLLIDELHAGTLVP
jgi:hypothetical protein